ncbi:MAG: hypothetical protein ACR2RB_07405, partial [Gammaproteobacteria bacterium]
MREWHVHRNNINTVARPNIIGPLVYSWIGEKDSGVRYSVMGTNVFSFPEVQTSLTASVLQVFNWVTKRDSTNDI